MFPCSYFSFLRYKPYSDASQFKELIKDRIADDPVQGYKRLQVVLQVSMPLYRLSRHAAMQQHYTRFEQYTASC